jgi:hypothetical protein
MTMWPGPTTAIIFLPGTWRDSDCALREFAVVCEGSGQPASSVRLNVVGDRWLLPSFLSWTEAALACAQIGDVLLHPRDAGDNEALARALGPDGNTRSVWLGATDTPVEGAWHWQSGQPVGGSFRFWAESEPNDLLDEDCAQMQRRGENSNLHWFWNDSRCDLPAAALCDDVDATSSICTILPGVTPPRRSICSLRRTQEEARRACNAAGGELARFDSFAEWDLLAEALDQHAPTAGPFWIDGTDAVEEGVWRRSDGTVIDDVR